MSVSLLDWTALQNPPHRVAQDLTLTVLLSINRAFLRLWVAKDAYSPGNSGYFSANRTKVELLAVFPIIATNPFEFNVDGVLGMDDPESRRGRFSKAG